MHISWKKGFDLIGLNNQAIYVLLTFFQNYIFKKNCMPLSLFPCVAFYHYIGIANTLIEHHKFITE